MEEREKKKSLVGIGGWLLVYVILVCWAIIQDVYGLIIHSRSITFTIISLILSIGILTFIFRKSSKGPTWIIILIWISFVLSSLQIIISPDVSSALSSLSSLGLGIGIGFIIVSIILSSVWAVIWTLYFKKSVRVKNTFVK